MSSPLQQLLEQLRQLETQILSTDPTQCEGIRAILHNFGVQFRTLDASIGNTEREHLAQIAEDFQDAQNRVQNLQRIAGQLRTLREGTASRFQNLLQSVQRNCGNFRSSRTDAGEGEADFRLDVGKLPELEIPDVLRQGLSGAGECTGASCHCRGSGARTQSAATPSASSPLPPAAQPPAAASARNKARPRNPVTRPMTVKRGAVRPVTAPAPAPAPVPAPSSPLPSPSPPGPVPSPSVPAATPLTSPSSPVPIPVRASARAVPPTKPHPLAARSKARAPATRGRARGGARTVREARQGARTSYRERAGQCHGCRNKSDSDRGSSSEHSDLSSSSGESESEQEQQWHRLMWDVCQSACEAHAHPRKREEDDE
jgi:hypothetical protein